MGRKNHFNVEQTHQICLSQLTGYTLIRLLAFARILNQVQERTYSVRSSNDHADSVGLQQTLTPIERAVQTVPRQLRFTDCS